MRRNILVILVMVVAFWAAWLAVGGNDDVSDSSDPNRNSVNPTPSELLSPSPVSLQAGAVDASPVPTPVPTPTPGPTDAPEPSPIPEPTAGGQQTEDMAGVGARTDTEDTGGEADTVGEPAVTEVVGSAAQAVASPAPERESPPPAPQAAEAPAVTDDRGELAALVHATFPDDPRMGNHVVWGESLFSADLWWGYVYGGVWSATGDCGLMQINWASHAEKFAAYGWTQADCFIPERNLIIAREIYDGSGPWAWTTY